MVISELIQKTKAELLENADFEAREIVMHVLNLSRNDLIMHANDEVPPKCVENVAKLVKRRVSGEPLQYILGFAEFMSLDFKVTKDVLIPRSDTEALVEKILEITKDKKIKVLDIGTGSGCIGISIAYYNKNADVTLLDVSKNALEIAKYNAVKNNVNVRLLNMDILNEYPDEEFDIIVSNPPYIESDVINTLQTEVKDFEPISALDGGEDGLIFYRRITDIASELLTDNGMLFYEIGYNQGKSVFDIMSKNFKNVIVIKDLCGMDRVVYGQKHNILCM